jgi:hypothetical protein
MNILIGYLRYGKMDFINYNDLVTISKNSPKSCQHNDTHGILKVCSSKDYKYENKEKQMLNTLSPDTLICVYCEQVVAEKIDYSRTQICVPCNEYKSVTTVREYLEVYA